MSAHPWKISIYDNRDLLMVKCLIFCVDGIDMDDAIRKARARLPEGFKDTSVWAQRAD